MSELVRPPDPLERHIAEWQDSCREPGLVEHTVRRLEERHFSLFGVREP